MSMQPLKKRRHWTVRGVRAYLSLILVLVYVASQSLTLSHNAEFGPDHIHDHQEHDHLEHHEIDAGVMGTVFSVPIGEPDSDSDHELCAFVLHSDRCGVADAPVIQNVLSLEFFDLDYLWARYGSVARLHAFDVQARAPPSRA